MSIDRSFVAGAVVLALGLIGVICGGATPVQAAGAAASELELTLEYHVSWEGPWNPNSVEGTFTAGAPFCPSGTFVATTPRVGSSDTRYAFTCDDNSGGLDASALYPFDAYGEGQVAEGGFRILAGTGSYAGLRGRGTQRTENLGEHLVDPGCVGEYEVSCPSIVTWRSTLRGVAGEDAVAPAVAFSAVKARKLPQPADAYSLHLELALRDNVEGPIAYLLRVTPTTSVRELARSFGATRDGAASMTMRFRYHNPAKRAVLLRLGVSDEVGNESSASQVVRLPR